MAHETLLITGADVRDLLSLAECIDAVEQVFGMHARGEVPEPAVLAVHTDRGGFHVKAAAANLPRSYFVAKTNANFPSNRARSGLPTIQGVIVLCDGDDGRPLAVMDSMEVTTLRTGAATGVAARHLARPDSAVATIVGCGIQGRIQLRAIAAVLPHLERVHAFDTDRGAVERFSSEMSIQLGLAVDPADEIRAAALESDVCVTCTTSQAPVLGPDDVRAGTFIAAVGADNPEKHELDPQLCAAGTMIVDLLDQCGDIGELHHALKAEAMTRDAVHAELGEIVAALVPGRSSPEDTIIFDSTGTALQDVAAAAWVYERAVKRPGQGRIAFGS